jgi:hypothetical protein
VKSKNTFTSIFIITLALSFLIFIANQPSASACTISLGKKTEFDMELSPKVPLFNPAKDGYFYPGSPKITKNLEVKNVGDVQFTICRFDATFHGNTRLANGLQTEILEIGTGKGAKPQLLYTGTLSTLKKGTEARGKSAIAPGKSTTLRMTVWMPITAGNEYQGLSMTADIAITVRFSPGNDGINCEH